MAVIRYFSPPRDSYVEIDTANGQISLYSDEDYTTLETTEAATPEELVLAAALDTPAQAPQEEVLAKLKVALSSLRASTADGRITTAEATALRSSVIPALESFRDLGEADSKSMFVALLLLAQVTQAIFIQGGQQAAIYAAMATNVLEHENRLDAIEAALEALS